MLLMCGESIDCNVLIEKGYRLPVESCVGQSDGVRESHDPVVVDSSARMFIPM